MHSLILKSPKHRGNSSSQAQFASASGLSDLLGCGAVLEPSAGGMLDPIALHSKCVFKSWVWLILPTENMRSTNYGIFTNIWAISYGILPTSILSAWEPRSSCDEYLFYDVAEGVSNVAFTGQERVAGGQMPQGV